MPADNQLGDHGDMLSHCFSEGIVNAASPNHLWFQCFRHGTNLQINVNGNKLIQNWNCPIFSQVMFFLYLLPNRKYEKKRDYVGKGIRGNSHAVWFHTASLTRHGQNHHQSAIIHNIWALIDPFTQWHYGNGSLCTISLNNWNRSVWHNHAVTTWLSWCFNEITIHKMQCIFPLMYPTFISTKFWGELYPEVFRKKSVALRRL